VFKKHSYDTQLGTLVSYAKGLGLAVYFREWKKGFPAAQWQLDGACIEIYRKKNQSKMQTIICLIHEVSHHLDFIHHKNRQYDEEFGESLEALDNSTLLKERTKKRDRLILYKNEARSAQWWDTVYKECNLTFPISRLHLEREFDLFWYHYYYENDKYPTGKLLQKKRRELRKKYGYKVKNQKSE
jgi:hypothetical protein